ncbi:MAG TPA: DUF5916 domain-containing protein [Thermoanaerobaculia bacterium]|nr:DUF5916 domain-containing protein [Thermoanaerobaculia bacterium]
MKRSIAIGIALAAFAAAAAAQTSPPDEPPIAIHRAPGPITVDGDLSDPGWQGAARVETFYETKPGDNVAPKVRKVGLLTFDDHALYAAFECDDPDPSKIRAPFADRDAISSDTDYAGIILDTRHDRRTAIEFLANPRGVQYDAVQDDASGNEDTSVDFFWDAAGKIGPRGWTLEIRIPFSSLRYDASAHPVWGIQLYRNSTRDTRYQYFSNRLPRSSDCFICHERDLVGLTDLPSGGHLIAAPYVTATEEGRRTDPNDISSPWVNRPIRGNAGLDVKWLPNADTAVDGTINPDFSQVESDVAQISANTRFALFYPEKRPFFLEGLDLLSTPIPAVYTRTFTSPRWGIRGTGKIDSTNYTLLVTEDRGGGAVIVPGPQSSTFVDQDFSSFAGIGRVRKDFGRSYVSFLATDREVEGTGYNRVFGPDFQWAPDDSNQIRGQFLYAASQNPTRPDLFSGWNGQHVSGHAAFVSWDSTKLTHGWYVEGWDVSDGFRADDGFVPQVGYREVKPEFSLHFYPTGFFTKIRPLVMEDYTADTSGRTLRQRIFPGVSFEGHRSVQGEVDYLFSSERVGDKLIRKDFWSIYFQLTPSRVFGQISINGEIGDQIDYANARPGHGGAFTLASRIQPEDHLELRLNEAFQWIDVDDGTGSTRRLFTAVVHRLRAVYNFTNRAFVRGIVQYVREDRNPALYSQAGLPKEDAALSSSILLAYKLNWQSVLFLGYGDNQALNDNYELARHDRQIFLKISYAFQR